MATVTTVSWSRRDDDRPAGAGSTPATPAPAAGPRSCSRRRSAHEQAEALQVDVGARHVADDPSPVDDDDAMGEGQDLLQLGGDEEHADAGIGCGPQAARPCTRWHRRRGRGSAERRRAPWARPTARGPARPAAGCRRTAAASACPARGPRSRTRPSARWPAAAWPAGPPSPAGRRRAGSAMARFSATVIPSTQPESWRSSGIDADAGRGHRAGPAGGHRHAVDLDRARRRARSSDRQHVAQLSLPVALDPGHTDDLARPDRRGRGRRAVGEPSSPRDRCALDPQHRRRRSRAARPCTAHALDGLRQAERRRLRAQRDLPARPWRGPASGRRPPPPEGGRPLGRSA